jgi:hypothetical protein
MEHTKGILVWLAVIDLNIKDENSLINQNNEYAVFDNF